MAADGEPQTDVIVPRWEWRTFGDAFPTAEEHLAAGPPGSVHESDELYVLSTRSDASVKVRDELMDVKQLQDVNEDGLELWKPVMKAPFPLAADGVAAVMGALGVSVPETGRDAASVEHLVDDVVRPNPDLRPAEVHKRRTRYVLDGCMVEMTEIRTDGASTRTVAVESTDPALVLTTIGRLGLAGRRNVNVARGLKALVGFGATRSAVIDVGTNSVKFHLGEVAADGSVATVVDRADVTRLGEGLAESGQLSRVAIGRTVDAIAAMVDEARDHDVQDIVAVGTAGLRMAPNSDEFLAAVRERCDLAIEVISGDEEGRLAYLAATSTLPGAVRGRMVVFDSGGGSSQFTFGRGNDVDERFSVDVGAVRISERFGLGGPVGEDVLHDALAAVSGDLSRLAGRERPDAVIGIGGTSTNLAAVKHGLATYDPDVVHGTVLDVGEIDRQIELYRTKSADERRQIPGLQPARADVILGGACIVRTIMSELGHESFTVSDRGLRHGVFVDRFAS